MVEMEEAQERPVIFKDIRRYYCDHCGISRSKKSLIAAHLQSHHKDELNQKEEKDEQKDGSKSNVCEECGVSFKKPAHLKQHMQSHSLEVGRPPEKTFKNASLTRSSTERPFACPVDDCHSSYRRKDHLTRHLLLHEGKLYECPVSSCNRTFTLQGNMTRHVREFHDENDSSKATDESQKQYVCPEVGCGKVFKFASKLQRHENSHVKLDSVEAFCGAPGCMKHFTNEKCLREHIRTCHQYITCETCGTRQLKKNIKRHLRSHEAEKSQPRVKCDFDGCLHSFSNKSNLHQHIKAVHLEVKPFICSFPACGMRFAFKHVRDKHEKSGSHVFTQGDFEEADEQFRSRPRGGRKRKLPAIESLLRKRICLPSESDHVFNLERDYLSRLLDTDFGDEV